MEFQPVTYEHEELPHERSIRVIRLGPHDDLAAPLICHLDAILLDDEQKPKYCALSYSWNAQLPSHTIACASANRAGTLNITPNCAAAMRQLRLPTEETVLWIDSICIDQTSIPERNSQVTLMSEIYRDADRVVVRLGEKDEAMAGAINLLQEIGASDGIREIGAKEDADGEDIRAALHSRARRLTRGT